MLGNWAHEGPQPPSNLEETKGLKEAQHAAHSHPPRTRGVISALLEGPHRDPRLRPASPPRSTAANLPRAEKSSPSHSRAANLPRVGNSSPPRSRPPLGVRDKTALPLNRPSCGGIECQPLLHSAQDRRRQAAIPHSGCDRSPIRQLRSLLRHPRRCSSNVGPTTRDAACLTLLPYYSTNSGRPDSTSSHVWSRTRLLLRKGSGDATYPSKRDAQHTQPEVPDLPPRGVQDLHATLRPP